MAKKFKIIKHTLLILVCNIILCLSVSYAWFLDNSITSSNDFEVSVLNSSLVSSYEYYETIALTSKDASKIYTFSDVQSSSSNLKEYSLLGDGMYQLLIKVNLSEYATNRDYIKVNGVTKADHFLGEINPSTNALYDSLKVSKNSLSSIVRFWAFTSLDATNSIEVSESSFLNFTSNYTLVSSKSVHITEFENTNHTLTSFYILLDYDVDLIEYIYSANIGNDVVSGDGTDGFISYICDFYFLLLDRMGE